MNRQLLFQIALLCLAAHQAGSWLQAPYFEHSQSAKLLLNWDDVWEVGDIGVVAVLRAGTRIGVRLRVLGDTGIGMRRLLSFRCPRSDAPDTVDLGSIGEAAASVTRCGDSLPFKISLSDRANEDYSVHIGQSVLEKTDVFKETLQLMVRVEFSTGRLVSMPLRIWNLDPITAVPAYTSADGNSFSPSFLTQNATKLATSIFSHTDTFASVQFLTSEIVKLVADAPEFLKAKLNLGMILYFDSSSCITYQLGKSMLLVNYHSKMGSMHRDHAKLFYLNLRDGKLWFFTCGLSKEIQGFFKECKPKYSVGICTIASVTGDSEPYVSTGPVRLRIPLTEVSYLGCNVTRIARNCEVVPNVQRQVTIMTGMDNTALVCPILCSDSSEVYRFYRNGTPLIPSQLLEWNVIDGIRVSRSGNIIEFTPSVSSAHSGVYKCEAGSRQFEFLVTVVSMPHFTQTSSAASASSATESSGLLPEKVFAMEGESLSYNCTVRFSGLSSVTVTPVFYMPRVSDGKVSWDRSANEEAFRQKVSSSDRWMTVNMSSSGSSRTLSMYIAQVPAANPSLATNFSHRFECSASVSSAESKWMGSSDYSVSSSGSDVVFIRRFSMDDFVINITRICFSKSCSISNGTLFEFRLSDEMLIFLSKVEVELQVFLRLGSTPLFPGSPPLQDTTTCNIDTDNPQGRISLWVHPSRSLELEAGRNLTPVFNLRYPASTKLGSLKMSKSPALPGESLLASNCRQDRLCFYSTDFDVASRLQNLTVGLNLRQRSDAGAPQSLAGASAQILATIFVSLLLLIGLAIGIRMATRDSERTYQVAEQELRRGYDPQAEARAEVFSEYQQRQDGSNNSELKLSIISRVSGESSAQASVEEIDYREYAEQGSFIGNYQTESSRAGQGHLMRNFSHFAEA